ncbi:MAG TPA: translation initiation factor IF-2 [Candidatus Eisenbacteria bacterium]|nr:translation initiation factor IF-2 [Candidatus Eisenbacteria bacterium]
MNHITFAPVVSVLGHVDHGKTTLLDAIRKSSVAAREHGGITQKIGASSVEIATDSGKRKITLVDTPGHAAFSAMRGRGARVADVGILVVAANDGIMPQTKESIQILKNAGIPFIVAFTKADLPDINTEKVKQQLLKEEVMIDSLGGDVPSLEVSAKTGKNIKELLDLVALVFDMHYTDEKMTGKVGEDQPLEAVVIESKLDPKSGAKATVVVKNGTLTVKDMVVVGSAKGKVRALISDTGAQLPKATIGEGVEILGFETVPPVGGIVRKQGEEAGDLVAAPVVAKKLTDEETVLSLILVADTQGSLEALLHSLPEGIRVILSKTGDVSEADIIMAKQVGAFVLTFNIKLKPDVIKFAIQEKVLLKNYGIIYELLDELRDAKDGKVLSGMEQVYGGAQILASFPFEKSLVLGIRVVEGRIAKGDKIRLTRDDIVIGESSIVSLRKGKEIASKAEKNEEAGIIISPQLDFLVGDVIISHS